MFDANDYKIEELSRKAAEDFSDETLIPSWQQLEKKLDIELPVKKKRRRVFGFWIFLAALLGSFIYIGKESSFIKQNHTNIIAQTTEHNKTNKPEENILSTLTTENFYKDSLNIRSNQSPKYIIRNNKLSSTKIIYRISGRKSVASNLESDEIAVINKASINQNRDLQIQKSYTKKLSGEKDETDNPVSFSTINTENEDTENEKHRLLKTTLLPTETVNKVNASVISDSLFSDKQKTGTDKLNTDKEITKKEKSKHSFSVAAVAGGNINSVNFNKSSRVGFDYGFLLGYKLSSKFEIKTGVIFSRKYFSTTGKSISFDSAKLNLPSYTSIKMQDATGYCRFVEVPVMLYYSFPAKSKTSFYTGIGFSINKMRMEKIGYTFLINTNTIVERTHLGAYHNADGYTTSVTSNFSFGLKQKLSERWAFVLEPYLKIPLTKVNDSDLKLTTYGAWSSLILTLPNKRNK